MNRISFGMLPAAARRARMRSINESAPATDKVRLPIVSAASIPRIPSESRFLLMSRNSFSSCCLPSLVECLLANPLIPMCRMLLTYIMAIECLAALPS